MSEREFRAQRHTEKSTGMSFPVGKLIKEAYSASIRTVVAAGIFHNGPGSTHCGFCQVATRGLQMPRLNGGSESAPA